MFLWTVYTMPAQRTRTPVQSPSHPRGGDDMEIQPYLFFDGRCDEAIEFYRKAVGAEVAMLMRFKDSPDQAGCPAGAADKVMHAAIRIGGSTVLASDGHNKGNPVFEGFSLSLTAADDAEAQKRFAA